MKKQTTEETDERTNVTNYSMNYFMDERTNELSSALFQYSKTLAYCKMYGEYTYWTIKIIEFCTQVQNVRADDPTSQARNRAVEACSMTTEESSVLTISLYMYMRETVFEQ